MKTIITKSISLLLFSLSFSLGLIAQEESVNEAKELRIRTAITNKTKDGDVQTIDVEVGHMIEVFGKKRREKMNSHVFITIPKEWQSQNRQIGNTVIKTVKNKRGKTGEIILKTDTKGFIISLSASRLILKEGMLVEPGGIWDALWNCLYQNMAAENTSTFSYRIDEASNCFDTFIKCMEIPNS